MISSTQQKSSYISIPTLEGDLIIELFSSFAPRACKYLIELLTSSSSSSSFFSSQVQPNQLAFTTRNSSAAFVTTLANSSSSSSTIFSGTPSFSSSLSASFFFGDELDSSDKLKFTGAGIIGVPCEPNLSSNAFFVTLAPMMGDEGGASASSSIVVGRVVQGLNAVVGYLVRARMSGNAGATRQFVNPLKILRAGQLFEQEPMPRPSHVGNVGAGVVAPSNQNQKKTEEIPVVNKKKSSLLDSMFDDDE